MKNKGLVVNILLLFFVLLLFSKITVYAEEIPKIDSEINADNALKILKEYDPDGYYIVNYNSQKGWSNFAFWISDIHESNASALDVAVHEEFHTYSYYKAFMIGNLFNGETIYIGDEKEILVDQNSNATIFPTSEMAEQIPSEMRTFRYNDYVSKDSNTSANLDGAYGLLQEFTAYSWGMNNQLKLFEYYKSQGNSYDIWSQFVSGCANNRQAFAEFRFWILRYLEYARVNYPAVYEHFMQNQNFIDSYCTTEKRFELMIDEFDSKCEEIVELCKADGHQVCFYEDYFYFDNRGEDVFGNTYKMLITETEKEEYQAIEKMLFSKGRIKLIGYDIKKGDINWDCEVNRADRMYLARAIAGWDGYKLPSCEMADFNDDGIVNRADRMYLARAIAGWGGYVK